MTNFIDHVSNEQINRYAKNAAKGGGWLAAVAEAMGKAMGNQAARVVGLANAIAENATQRSGVANDPRDQRLAAQAQALNAQFAAASQELSYTSNSFSTAIKALGEASTNLARKQ